MIYGHELILDLHNCDSSMFNREVIDDFFDSVCRTTGMKKEEVHFWDDLGVEEEKKQTNPKTKGTTAVQFILTSNITIHTLDLLGKVFINFFSCKDFNPLQVIALSKSYFGGEIVNELYITRL